MGTFIKALRGGVIASPLRADFDLRVWCNAGQPKAASDVADLQLLLAGVLFHRKLRQVWERFEQLDLTGLPSEKLRQAYVAVANRDFATIKGKSDKKVAEFVQRTPTYAEEIISLKVGPAVNGLEYAAYDLVGASVDGLHMPLRKSYERRAGKTEKLDVRELCRAIALGQLQWCVASIWEECVWCDWEMASHGDYIIALPRNEEQARARAIGHARTNVLAFVMTQHAFNLWRQMSDATRRDINSERRTVQVNGTGRRMELRVVPANTNPAVPLRSFVLRTIASEIYFQDIFTSQLPKLNGVTVGLLLSAWEVLHSLGEALSAKMPQESAISTLADLWQFAPRIPRAKLYRLLAQALELKFEIARRIIDFLIFSPSQQEEIWARPFIALDDQLVTPVVACLTNPNPLRMVEKWMKLGGIDLQQRGEAFEEHAREQLAEALSASSILKGGVCPHRYKLKRRADNPGDIDLILWFGNTVLIGEVKCTLFPARASEFHNYFTTLERAGRQISRKAAAFKSGTDQFWRQIAKSPPPAETRVVPFVLTNLCFGVGMRFSGVPAVDLLILERFVGDGFLERFVMFEPDGKHTAGETLKFYSSAEEAEQAVERYLCDPPQLEHFRTGLHRVTNVLPTVGAHDVGWVVAEYDVEMRHDKLVSLRTACIEDAQSA